MPNRERVSDENTTAPIVFNGSVIAVYGDAHSAEITTLKTELAALKRSQQQQFNALAKLTALMETSQRLPQNSRRSVVTLSHVPVVTPR